jgi:hypothetical protein
MGVLAWHYSNLDEQKVQITSTMSRSWLMRNPQGAKALLQESSDIDERIVDMKSLGRLSLKLDQETRWVYPTFRKRFLKPESSNQSLLSVMDVTAHSTGLLVLSEMHYPGWRATRNGDPIEIHRVNGGLRGIVVPRGENSITFEYAPASVYVGGAITLLTLFSVLLGWILLGWAPNRRKKRPV